MIYILNLTAKFVTAENVLINQFLKCLSLPDDWFEEVVDNTDEVGGMDDETAFQVLLVPSIKDLQWSVLDILNKNDNYFIKAPKP